MSTETFDPVEERWNTITHGIGAIASLVGLILLIIGALEQKDALKLVTFVIYGSSMIFLFASSTLYHGMHGKPVEDRLQILDHAAIYLLIAGTYTPFSLLVLRGAWGWSIFGVIWGMALLGIFFKFYGIWRSSRVSAIIYLIMGWLIIIAIKPLLANMPEGGWKWVIGGGLFYSSGVIFYLWQKLKYNHLIWHLFVLGGAFCHFLGVYFCLMPL